MASEEKGKSQFEKVASANKSVVGDFIDYLKMNKKWWLIPILSTLFLVGVLLLLSTTAAAPFIYTLF